MSCCDRYNITTTENSQQGGITVITYYLYHISYMHAALRCSPLNSVLYPAIGYVKSNQFDYRIQSTARNRAKGVIVTVAKPPIFTSQGSIMHRSVRRVMVYGSAIVAQAIVAQATKNIYAVQYWPASATTSTRSGN